jgi:hypothetical protein
LEDEARYAIFDYTYVERFDSMNFESFYKKATLALQSYPLHIARIQTIRDLRVQRADFRLATRQRFARAVGVKLHTFQASLIEIIHYTVGFLPSDRQERQLKGSLDPLKAHNIIKGPFRINLTNEPSRHLTFNDESDGRPTLLLLSPQGIIALFCIQHAGLFRFHLLRYQY